jgi:antirestriction protein ArdC
MAKTKSNKAKADAERTALKAQLEAFEDADHNDWVLVQIQHFNGHYSMRNAMLIVMQCPTAVQVAGYKAWQALGRQVRKGEHGIRIMAPAGRGAGTEPTEAEPEGKPGRQFFRLTSVFDITQTDPIEEQAPTEPIDWPDSLYEDEVE